MFAHSYLSKLLLRSVIFMGFFTSQVIAAQLEKIGFSTLPGNRVQIALNFSGKIPSPLSFTTDNPARIVLDFPGVTMNLSKKSHAIGIGVVQSAGAVQTDDRTRMVFNLIRMAPYDIQVVGDKVFVSVENSTAPSTLVAEQPMLSAKMQPSPPPAYVPKPSSSFPSTPPSSPPFEEPSPVSRRATPTQFEEPAPVSSEMTQREVAQVEGDYIKDIDFRRTPTGTGRIVVTLSNPNIVVNAYEQGENIVLEFLNTLLPPKLDHRLDVIDFGTPISFIDTFPEGDKTRMNITVAGDHEYFASQTDTSYTVEVQKKTEVKKEEVKIEDKKYEGQLVSFNFQNIEVRAALALLFDLPGVNLNMVASDQVAGTITLRLKKIPWDQALDIILEARGLGMRKLGNVVLIDIKENIDNRKQRELEAQKRIKELEPVRTEFIQINYAKAKDLESLLRTKGEHSFLSERGNVSMDERTNTLIIQDTSAKLSEIRDLISSLDTPIRQVLIESRVVLASDDFGKKLGVKFGYSANEDLGHGNGVVLGGKMGGDTKFQGNTAFGESNSSAYGSGGNNALTGSENFIVSLPITAPNAALGLAIGKIGSYLLQLELAAAENEGTSRIISSPRVITGNQKKASILQGSEVPYQVVQNNTVTTEFKNAVLQLEVTPQITPDDRIIMDLKVNSDKIGQATPTGQLTIDKREVETQVLVDNGETVVLGGVYEQESTNNIVRIPFLSDLPFFGELFKSTDKATRKKELLIFVTPKIIKETT